MWRYRRKKDISMTVSCLDCWKLEYEYRLDKNNNEQVDAFETNPGLILSTPLHIPMCKFL